LAEKGAIQSPFEIKLPENLKEQSIIAIIMDAIRNSSNKPYIGYCQEEDNQLSDGSLNLKLNTYGKLFKLENNLLKFSTDIGSVHLLPLIRDYLLI
jgi:hypothetical protein